MKHCKRLLSLALCLCMICTVLPITAQAAEDVHNAHNNCGTTGCTNTDHGHSEVTAWTPVSQADVDTDGTLTLAAGGSYYLSENVTVTKTITISGPVNLCLNGKKLEHTDTVIEVQGGAELNICDCQNTGEITRTSNGSSTSNSDETAISVTTWVGKAKQTATLNLYGGTISSSSSGRTIDLYNNERNNEAVAAKFNMYGGEVHNSLNDLRSSAVFANYANIGSGFYRINIYGGSILCETGNAFDLMNNRNVRMQIAGGTVRGGWYAVDLCSGNELTLSGSVQITGGADYAGIDLPSDVTFTVKDDFVLAGETKISVEKSAGEADSVIIATPETGKSLDGKAQYFVSAQEGYFLESRDGALYLTACAITEQPTAENSCAVTANGSPTYQWYSVTRGAVPVTDDMTTNNGDTRYFSGSDQWMASVSGSTVTGFTLAMQKDDVLTLDFSRDYITILSVALSDRTQTVEGVETGRQIYTLTAPADGIYTLTINVLQDSSSGRYMMFAATVTADVPGDALDGQTAASLDTGKLEAGSYICKVTWENKTTLVSQSVHYTPPHTHSWSTGWTSDETHHWHECLNGCNEKGSYDEHTGGTATCTASAGCETCGTAYGAVDADNHSFGAPDYTWDGTSCTARRVCTRDGSHVESEIVQADVTVTQNQSCTADELSDYTATFTNAAFVEQTKTGVKTKDKLGHDFTGAWQSDSDNHWKKCSRCDETADSAEHTWNEGEITTPASCTDEGVKTFTCNVCKATKTEGIGATGHRWAENWTSDETHHWHECLNGCNEKGGYAEHTGGTATCTEKAVCAACETAYGTVDDANHTGEKVWSTQTETNHEQKWTCCGAVSVENESHAWADGVCSECGYACLHSDAADDGDCLTPVVCPVCNATIKAAETAHKWGRYMLTKPATMTSEGIETRYCQNPGCEQMQTRTVARLTAPSAPDKTEKDGYRTCRKDSTCPIEPYTDAVNTAWYHDGVHFCLESGLMAGVSAASFLPDGSVTRAQVVTILWRQEGRPAVNYAMQFKDVPAGEWFTEAVRWAVSSGVVTGYSDTAFGPNDTITREQFAAILYRYAQYKGMDVSAGGDTDILGFDDAPSISAYAVPAIRWACGSGIISGVSARTLAPQGLTSRAQAACMMQRFLTGIK